MSKIGEYKRFEKEVPYSIVPIDSPADILKWREAIEAKSIQKRQQAKDNAVAAWSQVQANRNAYFEGKWTPPIKIYEEIKPTVLTRLINWFLNIKL